MYLKDLKIGNEIEIFITRGQHRYHLVSKIEGTDPRKVYITLIASGNNVFKFKQTDIVELVYKERDKTWKWRNIKAGLARLDENLVHYFESGVEGESFNRRDTFRVQIMKKVEAIRFTPTRENVDMEGFDMDIPAKDLVEEGIEKSIVNIVVKDISESGIGFYSPVTMKVGDRIRVYFESEFGSMNCEGIIIRSVENKWKDYHLFYGCSFHRTDKNWARYIYAEQRLQLSKEKR